MKHLDRVLGGVLVAFSVTAFILLTVIAATGTATLSALPEKGDGLNARSAQPVERDLVQAMLPEGHETRTRPEKTPYSAPATVASELSALVDRSAKDRVSPDITSRIPRVRHEEDIPVVVSVLLDTEDDDTVRNEAANLLRRSGYSGLTDDLLKVLDDPKEGARFRAFCTQHLWMNVEKAGPDERAKIGSALHEALSDRHIPVRREALLALVRMRDPKGRETAVEWLLDEEADGLRDAAIRCVRELASVQDIAFDDAGNCFLATSSGKGDGAGILVLPAGATGGAVTLRSGVQASSIAVGPDGVVYYSTDRGEVRALDVDLAKVLEER